MCLRVEAYNNGNKPKIFVKSMEVVFDIFPDYFKSTLSSEFPISVLRDNSMVEDDCIIIASVNSDNTWGRIIGRIKVVTSFELLDVN